MPNTAIKVSHLTKVYKLYDKPIDRLKESLHPLKKQYHKDFYALNDVSFEIKKGETVGIIGKNGAGKSTLLKIITGVLTPTSGHVHVNGRIASLLELGAGFNPEYTGIENIYLQGTLMGYTHSEMEAKIDEILAFADIGDFVHQPVKMYSSGMFARLAFSVAINVDPDILIVDEALSVGDMAFQEKCILKMKSMLNAQRSILFVSHSLPSIRNFCHKAIWIKDGKMIMNNEANIVCEAYTEFMKQSIATQKIEKKVLQNIENLEKTIQILEVKTSKESYITDDDIEITIKLQFNKQTLDYAIGILIYDDEGKIVTLFNTIRDDIVLGKIFSYVKLIIPKNDFLSGEYFISISISDSNAMFAYDFEQYIESFTIKNKLSNSKLPISEGLFRAKHIWNTGIPEIQK
jgi:ABC-type polysaccharide/polyol phosphate transport system ATPase subunit